MLPGRGGGGDVTSLPDTWVGNHPGLPGPEFPLHREISPFGWLVFFKVSPDTEWDSRGDSFNRKGILQVIIISRFA